MDSYSPAHYYSGNDVKFSRFDDASEDYIYYLPEIYHNNENDVIDNHRKQDGDRDFMYTDTDSVSAANNIRKINYRDDNGGNDDVIVDVNKSYITTDDEDYYVARVIPRESDVYGNSRMSADVFHNNNTSVPPPLGVDLDNTKFEKIQSESESSQQRN